MRTFLAVVGFAAYLTSALSTAAQDAFGASQDTVVTAAAGEPEGWAAQNRIVYTVFASDFGPFAGTPGLNPVTGAVPCAIAPCAWSAGLQAPSGAELQSVELSACDGDASRQIVFFLLRSPKVPGSPIFLVPATGTGIAETPGCTTFWAPLTATEIVQNKDYSYVLVVNANPGTNLEWNQFRVFYRVP